MPEHAQPSQQAKAAASPAPAARSSHSPKSAPVLSLPNLREGNLTSSEIMQLQRTAGNQAVIQMVRSRSGAISQPSPPVLENQAVPPGNRFQTTGSSSESESNEEEWEEVHLGEAPSSQVPKAIPASQAAVPKAIPTPQIPKNLQGTGYSEAYSWLKQQASASKKTDLFSFFDDLKPEQKIQAIKAMVGNSTHATVENIQKNMMSGFFSKSFDWDKFSVISREAKKIDTTNHNADQDRDYAGYAALGTSTSAGGVSGLASFSKTLGAGGAESTALHAAPVASGLGGVTALTQIYNATQNYESGLSAAGKAQIVIGEGMTGAADIAKGTADTLNGVRKVGGMAASGAANVAAGVGAIVGGAAFMASGTVGYIESNRNAKKLGQLEEELAEHESEGDELTGQKRQAASLGRSTQEMNRTRSGMTAAKGAMMVAGGALLIAAAASPAGPILLTLAAVLGGVAAIVKFYRKYKRKEEFVDKALKVDEAAALPENKDVDKSKIRQSLLEKNGYNSVSQCYNQIVTDLADMLYKSGVVGEDEESRQIIEGIGLTIDKDKKAPGKDLIAKKLHT